MSKRGLSLQPKILIGRLLTRSGDQAWDFAVPLVLLKIFPDQLRVAALYFFLVKLLSVVLLPRLAALIDRWSRLKAARAGILLQFVGVVIGAGSIYGLFMVSDGPFGWSNPQTLTLFIALIFGGLLSGLGSTFMDIAIANDLVPSGLREEELTTFNSSLRQIDLFTEVTAPVLAGLLLTLDHPFVLLGFSLVALWNVISFFPELYLLQSIFRDRPDLIVKEIETSPQTKKTMWQKLSGGWSAFFKEPVALVAIAYAFLWLSVLSPHGVLLAAYLKDGWRLPEWAIGLFRGAGAFFGLFSTVVFPWAEKRWGLLNASRNFIVYQALTLIVALVFFLTGGLSGQIGFLVFILFSRVGLYGFSLGEMQIRQIGIGPSVRGEVNGFATALTGVATLALYGSGTLLPATEDFKILIVGSVGFVIVGCLVYGAWLTGPKSTALKI